MPNNSLQNKQSELAKDFRTKFNNTPPRTQRIFNYKSYYVAWFPPSVADFLIASSTLKPCCNFSFN